MKRLAAILSALLLLGSVSMHALASGSERVVGELDSTPKLLSEEDGWYLQTQMGCAVADAMRAFSGADIALLNNGDLIGSLPQGSITEDTVRAMFSEDRALAVAEVTSAELWLLLEQSVSHVTLNTSDETLIEDDSQYDGFCQLSGLTMKYDVSAPVGERVLDVTLENGETLDR